MSSTSEVDLETTNAGASLPALTSPFPEQPSSSTGTSSTENQQLLAVLPTCVPVISSLDSSKSVLAVAVQAESKPVSKVPASSSSAPSSGSKPAAAKVPAKKRVVKTNGGDLWRKAIEKAHSPPTPYPKLKIPFNLSTPEILARICDFIDGRDILNLYFTGDRALQHRLAVSIESWSFLCPMPGSYVHPTGPAWPPLVHTLGKIRHFDVQYLQAVVKDRHHDPLNFPIVSLSKFPTTLRTLKMQCRILESDYVHLKALTNLDSLSMGPPVKKPSNRLPSIPFSFLPPNLTFLHSSIPLSLADGDLIGSNAGTNDVEIITHEMRERVPCFQFLRRLDLPTTETLCDSFIRLLHEDTESVRIPLVRSIRPEVMLELPQNLQELWINFELHEPNEYLAALPASLSIFKLFGARNLNNDAFRTIPKTVTALRVPRASLQLELFAGQWPLPNLLALDIRGNNSGIILGDLPRGLRSLRLDGSYGQELLALPPKLTHLVLPQVRATDAFLDIISRDLITLKIPSSSDCTSACVWRIPPKLTRLIMGGSISDSHFQHLPRTLTSLSLPDTTSLTPNGIWGLPSQLRSLIMRQAPKPDPSLVTLFPSSLRVFASNFSTWGPVENALPAMKRAHNENLAREKARKLNSLDLIDGRRASVPH